MNLEFYFTVMIQIKMTSAKTTCIYLQVMDELDEKKRVALETTWKKVNTDFGSIFSTLLPGTSAKLEPEEGKSFLDGEYSATPCRANYKY